MGNTFLRALLGFVALTIAVVSMALVALWAFDTYGGGVWWASMAVVLLALVVEGGVYRSTLHDPIYDWIKEPQRQREAAERAAKEAASAAQRQRRDTRRA